MDIVEKARIFAVAGHAAVGQMRRYSHESYSVHPQAVAELLRSLGCSVSLQAAGWLHDLVEDTALSIDLICAEFGSEIATLVEMATSISTAADGNRKVRKALDLKHKLQASEDGQTLILADAFCNVRDIVQSNPSFACIYIPEKYELAKALTSAHAGLRKMLFDQLEVAMKELQLSEASHVPTK
jgi:guanosine-3',5'-bis(diphosphate) 3'-pyrophosphohydrolase